MRAVLGAVLEAFMTRLLSLGCRDVWSSSAMPEFGSGRGSVRGRDEVSDGAGELSRLVVFAACGVGTLSIFGE